MKEKYQEMIKTVSSQIAGEFLNRETDLAERALLSDGDISEITRQIGLETAKIVLEETVRECTDKKKAKVMRFKGDR